MDILIDKPPRLRGYDLHRIVEQYQQGQPALWADEGRQLRIRPRNAETPCYAPGKLLGFTVTACVSVKTKGKHRYYPIADWRSRKAWLERKAERHGFEILGVHVVPGMSRIEADDGRRFSLDSTRFTGLLRVADPARFGQALAQGVGATGSAFGLNLLIVQ